MSLLDTIAQYLLDIETLTKADIDEIVASGKLAWWENQLNEEKKVETETPDAA